MPVVIPVDHTSCCSPSSTTWKEHRGTTATHRGNSPHREAGNPHSAFTAFQLTWRHRWPTHSSCGLFLMFSTTWYLSEVFPPGERALSSLRWQPAAQMVETSPAGQDVVTLEHEAPPSCPFRHHTRAPTGRALTRLIFPSFLRGERRKRAPDSMFWQRKEMPLENELVVTFLWTRK